MIFVFLDFGIYHRWGEIYKKVEALSTIHVAKNSRDVAFWEDFNLSFYQSQRALRSQINFEGEYFYLLYLCDLRGEELGMGIISLSYIPTATSQTAFENRRQNRTDY